LLQIGVLNGNFLVKIELTDFMCHGKLEIEPGDRVTFITGENGSGKSAILNGLQEKAPTPYYCHFVV